MVRSALLYPGLLPLRKRGRPRKNLPTIDYGTRELQQKRQTIELYELQLTGTIASLLLKEGCLLMNELEPLQKVYLLKRQYLSLMSTNIEGKSYFHILSDPLQSHQRRSFPRTLMRENEEIEKAWKHLRSHLQRKNKNFLPFLDRIFSLMPYESMKEAYKRFCMDFTREHIQRMAHLAKEAW